MSPDDSNTQDEQPTEQASEQPEGTKSGPLKGLRLVFIGSLAGVSRRDAAQLARQNGAVVCEKVGPRVNMIVVGERDLPIHNEDEAEDWLSDTIRELFENGSLEIIDETRFWQRLGMLEQMPDGGDLSRLYTPAMLAEMLDVSVPVVRRWHRLGLIVPVRQVRQLPYFDYREVATARRLAQLLSDGMSPWMLEQRLDKLARYLPDVERPMAQLSVIIEGRNILLRQGEGLIEPTGQQLFDFDRVQREADEASEASCDHDTDTVGGVDGIGRTDNGTNDAVDGADATGIGDLRDAEPLSEAELEMLRPRAEEPVRMLSIFDPSASEQPETDPTAMRRMAAELEDDGQLAVAAEMLRASLAAGGPDPQVCFQLGELLYRLGDRTAARERYFMAIELDADFVEARANLGCVLAELGNRELAIAAFRGALACHNDYGDVHYHLAELLNQDSETEDEAGDSTATRRLDGEAADHYRRFLQLCPDSPLADRVRLRLGELDG